MPFTDYNFKVMWVTADGDLITRYVCCADTARKIAALHEGAVVIPLAADEREAGAA